MNTFKNFCNLYQKLWNSSYSKEFSRFPGFSRPGNWSFFPFPDRKLKNQEMCNSTWLKFSTIFSLNLKSCKIFVFNIVPPSKWYKWYHWLILTLSMTSLFDGTAHLYTVWKCVVCTLNTKISNLPLKAFMYIQLCISTLC